MKYGIHKQTEFLGRTLKIEWFSARVWNGILHYNLKTVQNLYDFLKSKTMVGSEFGEKSKTEILAFFKKHHIKINENEIGATLLSDQRKIIVEKTIHVN